MFTMSRGLADRLYQIALVVLGMILALSPLALWVAWSETVFVVVLGVGAVAMGLLFALISLGDENDVDRRAAGKQPILNPELIAEMHRLMPFTYHHRRLGDPRIRRKMAKLRALMRRPNE